MKEVYWISQVYDADNRVKAKSAALRDYFATKTIEEALRSYEEAQRREEVTTWTNIGLKS